MFARGLDPVVATEPESGLELGDVSIFDLISAFNEALKRVRVEEFGEIIDDRFTVVDKIESILNAVRSSGKIVFSSLFANLASRHEIVCTFLALLELIRLRQLQAHQDGDFKEIVITKET